MKFKLNHIALSVIMAFSMSSAVLAADSAQEQKIKREVGQANYYVTEFEKEVALQRGGEKMVWRSKKDALSRVQKLKEQYPDDPEVEKLFQRTKAALMKSKGCVTKVDPQWTKYKRDESELRKTVSELGEAEWKKILASGVDSIDKEFPAPDFKKVSVEDLAGRYVVLNDISYPGNQFYGATGEYVWHGKPSSGYYYVDIGGREWLGPYEAIKRYRRNVDASLADINTYTVIGKIVDITAEIPMAGEERKGKFQMGWVVEPVAIKVPGHVVAVYDEKSDSSGYFSGEDKVADIKSSWYTVKEIPQDVKPERLMEIFMTAIKEKNFDLYLECISPERKKTPVALSLIKYHWDLHQERFLREYVHATFDSAKVTVSKGFDENNAEENFFLDEEQKDILRKTQGVMVEYAVVESKAYDENGKQIGTPHPHKLVRTGGGRWYVDDYAGRF